MDTLPREVKRRLGERYRLDTWGPLQVREAPDGTRKYLFRAAAGPVEAVYIPDGRRHTLCVSTQAGCRLGCRFCATGRGGLRGNLSTGEILMQLHGLPERERVDHVVFMGMGEPLENTEAVLRAVEVLTDPRAYAIAARHITLSTVGLLPELERVLRETKINITVSLHSPFPEERARLMPVERRHPVREVLALLRRVPPGRRRRYTLAYMLFDGINDSDAHQRALAVLAAALPVRVNLLSYHPVEGVACRPAPPERLECFCRGLLAAGIPCTVRRSRGEEIAAACGLLATHSA